MKYNKQHVAILQDFYQDVLKGRKITAEEVEAEIDSLVRKHETHSLDDITEKLYARLCLAGEEFLNDN